MVCHWLQRNYWTILFEDECGCSVTVKTEHYVEMMRRKFISALRKKQGLNMNDITYQQDGAPSYCSNVLLDFLNKYFPEDRLISRRKNNQWPARFLDLSPADYILWRYLKERVYYSNPQTIEALKTNICQKIWKIPLKMCGNVIANFDVRVAAVIHRRRAWIEHVINY